MKANSPQQLTIETGKSGAVSALLLAPDAPRVCYVFAHGAGAGMTHSFMEAFANGLSERGIASLRYQFPYMEKAGKRPDPPPIAQAAVRAAVAKAAELFPRLGLIAGGKSFGGRMSSQAQAAAPLPGVRGLAFVGFPLHPAGKPSADRAEHLVKIECPMLFLQGTRDALAEVKLIEPVTQRLGNRATLHLVDGADHSFHVLARSGRSDREVMTEILDAFATWADLIAG
ncbi:MAG TPA: alpha/beta family hydrolase [Bradyrhizobium sp.]|uniref:alpha/beta hydrolase family protein n=1 Tax=Bradyrhizobium sp. TaxID=376 RepID=UPI002D8091A7|nr:alpha/beta family hydrolase [Bradyrhizobium sp.]HET7886447.1 alpha/beta family hydrolase [Bradyrhizobium sp.]